MITKGNFLTYVQRAALIACHRQERSSRHADRIKAILYLDSGMSPTEVAELLFMDDDTVRRYFATFTNAGLDGLLSDGYHPYQGKLSEGQKDELRAFVLSRAPLSVAPVIAFIKKEFHVKYTISGAASLLHSMDFVYKKPERVPGRADPEAQRGFVAELDELMATKGRDDQVWFIDGVHPTHNSQPAYGWLPKGEKVAVPANTGRGRVNINGAINIESREVAHVECDSVNAQSTVELLEKIRRRAPRRGKIIVFCDNARYYSSEMVEKYLKRRMRMELRFLPPYSPNLNPIERLWRFMKKIVCYNRYHETLGEFRGALLNFFSGLSGRYRGQLETLITTNFHIIDPKEIRVIGRA